MLPVFLAVLASAVSCDFTEALVLNTTQAQLDVHTSSNNLAQVNTVGDTGLDLRGPLFINSRDVLCI